MPLEFGDTMKAPPVVAATKVASAGAFVGLPPGIYPNVPERAYHADPAEGISASASVLKTLYNKSPEHAWTLHPKLNPDWEPSDPTDEKDKGTILHALMLDQPAPYRILHFKDYKTDAAKAAKEDARAAGMIPILGKKFDELPPVATALRTRLRRDYPDLWAALTDPGTLREVTIITHIEGALYRCRADALPPPGCKVICDFKFTGREAEPETWAKQMRGEHLFSAALYPRAVEAQRGDLPEFKFIVCEWDAPYGASVHAAGPLLIGKGWRRSQVALRRWNWCMQNGRWPSYLPVTYYSDPPSWWERQDDEAAARDAYTDRMMMDPPKVPESYESYIADVATERTDWGA
jgi:hypothetical protein